jgi:integrase
MTHGERPATGHRITKGLYAALERIGLSHEERTRRNINFHSFRHFFNSVMRARQIPVAVLQSVTGHTTLEMTDRYSHFSLDNFKEIVAVQAEVFA